MIEVDLSLSGARITRALDQIIEWRGLPKVIRCDNEQPNMAIGGITPKQKLQMAA